LAKHASVYFLYQIEFLNKKKKIMMKNEKKKIYSEVQHQKCNNYFPSIWITHYFGLPGRDE
jgi:hypothetical protein